VLAQPMKTRTPSAMFNIFRRWRLGYWWVEFEELALVPCEN
jgi:hypothetical protein